MSTEYTPTTDEIRTAYATTFARTPEGEKRAEAAFSRWLDAHDREVAAKALAALVSPEMVATAGEAITDLKRGGELQTTYSLARAGLTAVRDHLGGGND